MRLIGSAGRAAALGGADPSESAPRCSTVTLFVDQGAATGDADRSFEGGTLVVEPIDPAGHRHKGTPKVAAPFTLPHPVLQLPELPVNAGQLLMQGLGNPGGQRSEDLKQQALFLLRVLEGLALQVPALEREDGEPVGELTKGDGDLDHDAELAPPCCDLQRMPGSGTAPHLGCGQPTIGEPLKPARSAGRTSMDGTWTLQGANSRFSAVVARTGK